MKTNQYIKAIVIAVIVFTVPAILMAQPPIPGDGGGGTPGSPDVPIDGGLSILLGAGVSYVLKKGYDKRKKNSKTRSAE